MSWEQSKIIVYICRYVYLIVCLYSQFLTHRPPLGGPHDFTKNVFFLLRKCDKNIGSICTSTADEIICFSSFFVEINVKEFYNIVS